MLFSVYDYDNRRYAYYEAPGVTPPHGWFRKASPGRMLQPEEIAAALPAGAVLVGHGALPKGVIATTFPGVGSVDDSGPTGNAKREAGLGTYTGPSTERGQRWAGVRPQTVNMDPWESPNSRGRP